MAISYRNQKRWQQVAMLSLLGLGGGFSYAGLRMMAGALPFAVAELEAAARTGAVIGLLLGTFMTFCVYNTPGEVFRRMGFVKGWLALEAISVTLIAIAIISQRYVSAMVWDQFTGPDDYLRGELLFDILIAVLVFLLLTFIMQMKRLVGEGVIWNMITGRYHQPRKERRIYMFLDIKDSTALAERLGDEKTHQLISEVFFLADRIVSDNRGVVLSYNGDELVASWTEKTGLEDGRCLNCYREINQALNEKAEDYKAKYGIRPEFWAGFHVGEVVVGECGDSKLSIVHIGDTPNTAARLEHTAKEKGRDCLISGALMERITLPASLKAEPLGSVTLRGHSHETEIFAVEVV